MADWKTPHAPNRVVEVSVRLLQVGEKSLYEGHGFLRDWSSFQIQPRTGVLG